MTVDNSEDYAIQTVKKIRDNGDLIASFFLCSAFIEHYCKTRLFVVLTERRPIEVYQINKNRKSIIWTKMKDIIWNPTLSHSKIIDIGLLVCAWNKKLYDQLKHYNKKRNTLTHKYENLLKILDKDEEEVKTNIDLGLSLLHNIKFGYIETASLGHDK